ncbi:TetR/AcrR family transcriptional regulator [Roseibium denhamense]|uniref:Transcriptional regulator, TetR family n=1 Tax=Roseibium denhamense TaxID=76305 RepID=A0ABY1P7Q1_9HYPH|nr:TetR/AcrR family transcriptional regulator [Roseibium denhamense]MTI04542.1 TetR/AcrR family transcriptional regulator [Roseibium denhamense]SMP28362.1 transcriptional regulator, TetR family [Roseibium denhamense]
MAAQDTKVQTRAKGQATADRVRAAAMKRFAQAGYAAVSMREIASDVGVRPGALYNHFQTKQDILNDLMLGHMAQLLDAWETADFPDHMDALERFVRFHVRYHLERADEVFISYMELRNLEPDNFETIETERRKYEAILTEILEKGAQDGRYTPEHPKVTTRAIIAMLTGIPAWFRESGPLSKSDIEDHYVNLVQNAVLRAPGQSPRETG